VSLRLETLGALVEDGDGWALFGRTLLVRVGWVGGLPVELGRYDGPDSKRSTTRAVNGLSEGTSLPTAALICASYAPSRTT
jgi:hypothetical protein